MSGRLRVDPIACTGHGACAELFPERIRLDDWGFPLIDDAPIMTDALDAKKIAVAGGIYDIATGRVSLL